MALTAINMERKIHPMYQSKLKMLNAIKEKKMNVTKEMLKQIKRGFTGKYLETYSSKKGKIALVRIIEPELIKPTQYYGIYCLKGKLFRDEEQYKTKEEAVNRIGRLLK